MKISEIASMVGAVVEGDDSVEISAVAGIRDAAAGDISFIHNKKYAADAAETKASAVIVPKDWDRPCNGTLLRVDDADVAFTQVAIALMPPQPEYEPGVDPTAVIGEKVTLGNDVYIGPNVIIEDGAKIGARSIIMGNCYIGLNVKVGEDCQLYPNVSTRENIVIGDRVIIHNGSVIGSDGFGYTVDEQGVRTKIPQIGIVQVGDDVEIGANVAIDRARFGKTVIGKGVKIDNLVQIAHNVVIEDHAVVVAQVGISGSSVIGKHAILAGQVGIAGHLKVGEGAVIGAQSGISKDVPPKSFMFGSPAWPMNKTSRIYAVLGKLPELKKRLLDLEKKVKGLEG
ncbi:UDP-3-O-(3-hydroxymyristoyl)glucosamine N-acyltransferase [Verrucomicrobiota bacterium]